MTTHTRSHRNYGARPELMPKYGQRSFAGHIILCSYVVLAEDSIIIVTLAHNAICYISFHTA